MKTLRTAAILLVGFILLPAPAQAWLAWLDNLSGPGPFVGLGLQYRLSCMNDPKPEEIVRAEFKANLERELAQAQFDLVIKSTRPDSDDAKKNPKSVEDLVRTVEALLADLATTQRTRFFGYKDFDNKVEERRKSIDPGDGVLRSLESFHGAARNGATFVGAGCVTQPKKNPIASLNLRLSAYRSIQNTLSYSEPQYANGHGPAVWLLQPELSLTAYVDSAKAIELGTGAGISFAFTEKPGVSPFPYFFWRPIMLSVAPGPLLRARSHDWLRGIMLVSSIVLTPRGMKAADFGAIPGTYQVDRDWQGEFTFVIDLARFGHPDPKRTKS